MSLIRCEVCEKVIDLDFTDQWIDGHALCPFCQENFGQELVAEELENKLLEVTDGKTA